MYLISSVNSQVPSSQYVKLQVPVPMTGINVAAFGLDFWNDTGGAGGGTSTLSPIPAAGMDLDDMSRPHSSGSTRRTTATSRPDLPALQRLQRLSRGEERHSPRPSGRAASRRWTTGCGEMENTDVKLYKDGRVLASLRVLEAGRNRAPDRSANTRTTSSSTSRLPMTTVVPSMVVIQWYVRTAPCQGGLPAEIRKRRVLGAAMGRVAGDSPRSREAGTGTGLPSRGTPGPRLRGSSSPAAIARSPGTAALSNILIQGMALSGPVCAGRGGVHDDLQRRAGC